MATNENWLAGLQNAEFDTLVSWRQAIDTEIKRREAKQKADAKRKIKELAETYGIDLETLKGSQTQSKVRYRNPANQFETWSGKGRQPKWVKAWLEAGNKLDDLEVSL